MDDVPVAGPELDPFFREELGESKGLCEVDEQVIAFLRESDIRLIGNLHGAIDARGIEQETPHGSSVGCISRHLDYGCFRRFCQVDFMGFAPVSNRSRHFRK